MGVAVYSRLAELLEARNMTVRDLHREIVARFGRSFDSRALDRLTREARVRRPDMELAAAAAAVLGVTLGDLFAMDATAGPANDEAGAMPEQENDLLGSEQSQRLSGLFDLQDRRALSPAEQTELEQLVAAWAHAVSERGIQEVAQRRGEPPEQVRAGVLADVERAQAWWQEVQADPVRLRQAVREARALQKALTS
jgi:transcriptional regulator with XRE-family HTH domain